MNIFHKVALQGLKKNRTRTFVTVIGVMLSAALLTAVSSFGISMLHYMTQGAICKRGGWHVAFADVNRSAFQTLAADSDVSDAVSYENIGYAMLEGGQNPDKPYLFIEGFYQKTFDTLPIEMIGGRLPKNNTEVIVPMSVAVNGGVKFTIGDTLNVKVGIRQAGESMLSQHDPYTGEAETLAALSSKSYTVVGTYQRAAFEEYTAPGYTLITRVDAAQQETVSDSCSAFVTLKNPYQERAYADEHGASFLNDDVLRFMGLSDDKLFTTLLLAVGVIVVIIIMTGSVFLIYNAFHISLNERMHQMGILMSVGATAKQLQNAVLFEGICIGAAGIPAGILVGLAGMGAVIQIVNKSFTSIMYDQVSLTLVISPFAIGLSAMVGLITILISAWIPAHKAVRVPVMECIRQTNEVKVETRAVKTSAFAARIYGLEGILALKNFKRNKGRYRSIVLSLILSVVLFISVNAFVIDLKQASEMAVAFTTYDLALDAREMQDDRMLPLFETLKTIDDIYESSYQEILSYSCHVKGSDLTEDFCRVMKIESADQELQLSMSLYFLDDSTYVRMLKEAGLAEEQSTGEQVNFIALAKADDHRQRLKDVKEFADIFRNNEIQASIAPVKEGISLPEQSRTAGLTFVNVVFPDMVPNTEQTWMYAYNPYYFMVAVPYSLKEEFQTQEADVFSRGMTFRSKRPAQSAKEMERLISEEKITEDYQIWNVSKMLDDNNNMIFIANVFAYTFAVMISLIAVANVFNTISTNIRMRKRELAMLRSVGMSERDFQKMMNFECIFYGMRTLAVGIPLSVLISWFIYLGMTKGGAEEIDFVLPWGSMAASVIGVLLIVFITMLYATSKIKKENIIDALRDEMV